MTAVIFLLCCVAGVAIYSFLKAIFSAAIPHDIRTSRRYLPRLHPTHKQVHP